ncbi:transcription-repair coupling factor [Oscillospiraceae bacterium HV4-5-C5C]|nr:transcription-repair coupling factor [Oscillospiraceae bacterium HV4-5-C5C]
MPELLKNASDLIQASPAAQMLLRQACELDPGWQTVKKLWPVSSLNVSGPAQSQKACLLLTWQQALNRPVLLLVPDELAARSFQQDLEALAANPDRVQSFPGREYELGDAEAVSRENEHRRLGCLRRLAEGQTDILLVPAPAVLQQLPPPELFKRFSLTLRPGQQVTDTTKDGASARSGGGPEALAAWLIKLGYERRPQAELPGEFARRGDIVDVAPVGLEQNLQPNRDSTGYRFSFFDDEIDQIRSYRLETQRSLEVLSEVLVTPAAELLVTALSRGQRDDLAARVRQAGEAALLHMRRRQVEPEVTRRLQEMLDGDLHAIHEGLNAARLDKWLPLLYSSPATVLDYAADYGCLTAVDEPIRVRSRMDSHQAEFVAQLGSLLPHGRSFPQAEALRPDGAACFRRLEQSRSVLSLTTLQGAAATLSGSRTVLISGQDAESYRGHEERLPELLRLRQAQGGLTILFAGDPERARRLAAYLSEQGTSQLPPIQAASLKRGFEYPAAASLLLLGCEDLFGHDRTRRRRRASQGVRIDFFSDLEPGEAVVHEAYGIGIYQGLSTHEDVNGVKRDFLTVTYGGGDQLFLPMDALDQLQKYVGSEGRTPKLSNLGSQEWNRLKERARSSIRKLAVDLVHLYAQRAQLNGHIFPPDSILDHEFEESFPYEETEDQLRCIKEIRADMESGKVMDRLLCGDVGFGKTEVAFRAIVKCVADGMQAAFLAPTTVLVQQHYENLLRRISDFPIRVGLLSRFATEAQRKKTLKGLANGSIDVVIGTHRILSRDVKFKNLGLLVVDEEQRFGVEHKERLRSLTPTVDTLTLSATPIPRTLHMSLSGIRDISVIEEPPEDRRPVQTYVMAYDEQVIADAILREIGRNGQVFYLFNDTYHIEEKALRLKELLPGARILTGHGKMGERALEDVINDFVHHEADILVCTTIIESGIDMPNVNTIIVEQADRLGLAQLYQLRGRVGRSARQAYAYITYRRDKVLTEVAEKRLTAIRDFTELGAGFKIALRDLEVRGSGNLLGAEQHGQMEAIGYDLYTRMLEEEIARLRAELGQAQPPAAASGAAGPVRRVSQPAGPAAEQAAAAAEENAAALPQPQIELPLDAYIPHEYIPDDGRRMDMYRRIAAIQNLADYQDVLDELMDRYGDIPEAVQTLCGVSYSRARAARLRIARISVLKDGLILELDSDSKLNMQALSLLLNMPQYKGQILFNAGTKPYLLYRKAAAPLKAAARRLARLFAALEQVQAQDGQAS